MIRRPVHCCVVGSTGCTAPANGPARSPRELATCYRCGEHVCRDPWCSLIVAGRPGLDPPRSRHRSCLPCLRQWLGDEIVDMLVADAIADPPADRAVIRRLGGRGSHRYWRHTGEAWVWPAHGQPRYELVPRKGPTRRRDSWAVHRIDPARWVILPQGTSLVVASHEADRLIRADHGDRRRTL